MADYAYRAFISYHHRVSGTMALALEKALRRYAKPLFRPPMRVFRDEEQIAAGQRLKETIKSALEKSEFLIYIATREAAESPYVSEELDIWCRQLNRQDRLIIVWQKDHLADDPNANSLLWGQTNVVPGSLKAHIAGIPIWVDLTWAISDEDLDLRNPRFKTLINSIIARFRNIPPEELIGEEIRVFRRNIRIRNWGLATLIMLLITAIAAAGFAWWQLNRARSTILMSQSDNILDQDKTIALQFAREAYTSKLGKPSSLIKDTLLKAHYHDGFHFSKKYIQKLQHSEGVTTATFSRTGDMILTGSVYGKISVWSSNGALLKLFAAHRFRIVSTDMSPDQTQIVTTGYMDTENNASVVKLWGIDGKLIDTLEGPPSEYAFADFAPSDNGILVSFGTPYYLDSVKFWEPGKTPVELMRKEHEGVKAAAFSKDGQHIWIITDRGTLELWSRTGERKNLFRLDYGKNRTVNFSKDGECVVSTSSNTLTCFDLNKRRVVGRFKPEDFKIASAISSPNSKHILTKSKDGAIVIYTCAGEIRSSFKPQGKEIRFIDFVGAGDRVFMATDLNLGSLWDLDGRLINTFSAHSKLISAAEISPDGRLLLTASLDGTVKLWPMKSNFFSKCGAERPKVADFDLCPTDDYLILIVDTDQQVHLWDLEHSQPASDLEHENSVQYAFFSPEGERIVTVHKPENELKLWSKNGQFIKKCCKHADPIHSANFSPDGSLIATYSISNDQGIKLWTDNGKLFKIPGIEEAPISHIKFSPDAKRIFVQSQRKILIFDRSTKKILLEMKINGFNDVRVHFSPDSRSLLVANGKELSIIDFDDLKNPTVIEDNDIYLHYILWLPNGDGFLVANTSGQVGVWDRNGNRRYRWRALGESGSFAPRFSPDSANVFNIKSGALYNLQGDRLNTIDSDRFVKYLPDGTYFLTVLEAHGRNSPNTLHLRDRYGNTVVSLGEIKGDIEETKISSSAKLIAIKTSSNNLVLRCTPEGIVDDLDKTDFYTPDTIDRLKYGIDW